VSRLSDAKCFSGKLLAENVAQCIRILKQINPAANIVVWSDAGRKRKDAVTAASNPPASRLRGWNGGILPRVLRDWPTFA